MLDFLNSFKSLVKLEKMHIDNNIFKLHYKFTVIILILFSILLTSKQYFGDPIDCDVQMDQKALVNTYCWIYGTYVLKDSINDKVLPGLGNGLKMNPYSSRVKNDGNNGFVSQKYYQWVCIVFCFQALLFYTPRYLWKSWEAGRLRLIVNDLGGPVMTPNWNAETKEKLLNYFVCRKYPHNVYALRFAFCELMNFANILFQIILLDWFLTGHFTPYGVAVALYNDINWMTLVFPKLTKCNYFRYGPSGDVELRDALCVLPLNIVNEKLFLFLWFWFLVLALLSLCQLIFRACVLISSTFREKLLRGRCRYLNENYAHAIVTNLSFGDLFLLDLFSQNVSPVLFKDLLSEIASLLITTKGGGLNKSAPLAEIVA